MTTNIHIRTLKKELIQRAIDKYDFEEDADFTVIISDYGPDFVIVKDDGLGNKPRTTDYTVFVTDAKSGKRDYIVTMDMAKV